MRDDMTGKVAVVTGSAGIGLGCAVRLARAGARVHLCGIDPEHNETAAGRLAGLDAEIHRIDVSDDAAIQALAADIARTDPDINALVNVAAIQPYGNIETTAPADWDRTIAVNLRSCYLMSHHFYPMMKGRADASIVHMASVQGHSSQNNVLAYATSKGAIHALTRAMAVDCARDGVRVNSISPGSIRTPLLEFAARELAPPGGSMEQTLLEFGNSHPIGRIGTTEEVAEMVAFLVGSMSGFCTGGDYPVDGGLRAQLGV